MLGRKHSTITKEKMSASRKGKRHYGKSTKLNDEIVYEIKSYLVKGMKATEVSKLLDVNYSNINNIISNNIWNDIEVDGWNEYLANRKTYTRLTKDEHRHIYNLHINEGYTKYELAKMYNKGVKTIEKIFRDQR